MSYFFTIEYEIVLKDSFLIIRGCPKCGRKTHFRNINKFRVNSNGNKLDIWLFYQCGECKHTFNLAIYERQRASLIPKDEYRRFLDNDEQLAEMYGKDIQFFQKNKAEIDPERMSCDFVKRHETMESTESNERIMVITHNPQKLKIRPEKQITGVLKLSRSQVKRLMEQGEIEMWKDLPQAVSASVSACVFEAAFT